ncbi:MAG: class B sortase [Eubacteriales bacterium]|nr:class B sortase [Eubacteriales bacterium]
MEEKKKRANPLTLIVLIVALSILAYSGYQLFTILDNYRRTDQEYNHLNKDYTKKKGTTTALTEDPDVWPRFEDAEVPLEIDWASLKAINPDVVGWIYVEAEEGISYPICWRKGDDDYYLHRSYEGNYLYAGAIFLEGLNMPDFADPISIVYGHNMKNGSMFASLKNLKEQETYQKNPYFWILTPNGNYRYHIYSVFQTSPYSEVYQLFAKRGSKFLAWEQAMQNASEVTNIVPLFEDDSTVILSTCESDHEHRNVVIGRCVSSVQPTRTNTDYVSVGTKGNTETDLLESEAAKAVQNENEKTTTDVFGENDLGF